MQAAAVERDDEFRVLAEGRFCGRHDGWTEYLCVDRLDDGRRVLLRRRYAVLAELGEFVTADDEPSTAGHALPAFVNGKAVGEVDGDYVLGDELVECDWDADLELEVGNSADVHAWLERHHWTRQRGFAPAWLEISRLAGWVVDWEPRRARAPNDARARRLEA
jgi:hypothetical protein